MILHFYFKTFSLFYSLEISSLKGQGSFNFAKAFRLVIICIKVLHTHDSYVLMFPPYRSIIPTLNINFKLCLGQDTKLVKGITSAWCKDDGFTLA